MTSLVYQLDGEIQSISELYDGKPFFRKMTTSKAELEVVNMLFNINTVNKNIVKIYNVTPTYFDMELLETNYTLTNQIIKQMAEVKDFLQSINIAYVDWKPDNIGIDAKGCSKLFDFDGCGICNANCSNANCNTWYITPFKGYAYNYASTIESDCKKIDDLCFEKYLLSATQSASSYG
jgi:serine/threonine protein kinase